MTHTDSTHFPWVDPVTGKSFDVATKIQQVNGAYRMIGISIQSVDGEQLTVEQYRRVPISTLMKKALSRIAPKPEMKATLKGAQRGSTLPDDLLEEVAQLYKQAVNYGNSPIAAIAQAFGVSQSTAAKRVMLARKLGYLGEAVRGKAGEK
jgi:hypothetical protein